MKVLTKPGRTLFTWPAASLRTYLVAVILLATVPIAVLMSYQIAEGVDNQAERLRHDLQRSAAALSQGIERELASSVDALTILSYATLLQQGNVAAFQQTLLSWPLLRPSWDGVYLVTSEGEVLFNTARPGQEHKLRTERLSDLQRVIGERKPVISSLLRDVDDDKIVTTIEVPVMIGGIPRYVLGARIEASVWQSLIAVGGIPENGVMTVFDSDHRVIARTRSPEITIGKKLPEGQIDSISGRPRGFHRVPSFESGSLYIAWDTVPLSGWGVGIGVMAEPIAAQHRRAILLSLITGLASLALGIFLALTVARRMTHPLHQLARNDLSEPTQRIAVHEISLLRDALMSAQSQDEVARELLKSQRDLLQKVADEFETLFASSPIGLAFAQDPQCRAVVHNAAMDALFGSWEMQMAGNVRIIHRGQLLPREQQPLQRAAARGDTITGQELEVRIDGRPPVFVFVNAVPLLDEKGMPRGAIGAVVDISERKEAEARLIRAEQHLRESQHLVDLAQEAGHVGFFHYHVGTHGLAWTPGLVKLFELPAGDADSGIEAWVRHIDPTDWLRIQRTLAFSLRRRRPKLTLECSIILPDGNTRWLSSRVLVIYAEDGEPLHMIGVSLDTTEQKQIESERAAFVEREKAARLEAEAANRSKDEFLAMLGHELRNPLSAITSAVEVLNRVEANAEVAINARSIIGRQARHLAHMMDDLLDVARVISGQVLMSRHTLDLGALVQRVIATLEITGEPSRHQLTLDLHEAWIDADTTRVEQVVGNLVTNAIKYTPAGGHIAVTVRREGADAVFEVRDNGVGIPPELLPRVFELFVQGERTLDRRAGGLGVGLTLARRLVELHGGQISAQSPLEADGRGSLLTVRLPATTAPAPARTQRVARQSKIQRVVLIEDNEDVLEALRTVLELDGHSVWTATDGVSGLALLLSTRPDIAVVDIGLPGLTGFEVAKRSRAGGYAGYMVALSGYGQERDVRQALTAGFDLHFLKPVDANELRRVIAQEG